MDRAQLVPRRADDRALGAPVVALVPATQSRNEALRWRGQDPAALDGFASMRSRKKGSFGDRLHTPAERGLDEGHVVLVSEVLARAWAA
jgi:hypothetical protein